MFYFGIVHKIETRSITFQVLESCSSKLLKCSLGNLAIRTPVEVNSRVYVEIEPQVNQLPKLKTLHLSSFAMCSDCNKPCDLTSAQFMCDCWGKTIVKGSAKIVGHEEKQYTYGPGVKLTMKLKDKEEAYYAVLFANSPFYNIAKQLKVDNFCFIKATVKDSTNDNVLLNVFSFEIDSM